MFERLRILSIKKLLPLDFCPTTVTKAISCPENLYKKLIPSGLKLISSELGSKDTRFTILSF
jgi:hypothetical protein